MSDPKFWFHCPGTQNPADLPTRGAKAGVLANSELWWSGPTWLREPEINWPKHNFEQIDSDLIAKERRKITLAVQVIERRGLQNIIDLNRHESLDKILRITAYVIRFVKMKTNKNSEKLAGPITAEEMGNAEIKWVVSIQSQIFAPELRNLNSGQKVENTSKYSTLQPILNESGIICLGGRLAESSMTYLEKHPILMEKCEKFGKLLMLRSHKEVRHGGVSDTITQLREKYWIPAGRQLAKTIVKNCLTCKRLTIKPMDTLTASLPHDRLDQCAPFTIIGIDFAGPLLVKDGNSTKKAYICLITCAVSRAIHLELVPSLNTEEFLLAFQRMITRRGTPSVVYSDNAKTFKRADSDLKLIWGNLDSEQLKEFFGTKKIVWKYIVERAAWYGGWWEILVKSTKTSLKKNLGLSYLSYTGLETAVLQAEGIINSRPLTYVYNDLAEPTPLSPAEILIGRRITSLPPFNLKLNNVPNSRKEFVKRMKHREVIINKFWNRFRCEYLRELRSAHYSKTTKNLHQIKTNDVVIIQDDKLKRHMWKIGRVIEIVKGRDGQIRSCIVKTSNGTKIRRSIKHLCNLEINQ